MKKQGSTTAFKIGIAVLSLAAAGSLALAQKYMGVDHAIARLESGEDTFEKIKTLAFPGRYPFGKSFPNADNLVVEAMTVSDSRGLALGWEDEGTAFSDAQGFGGYIFCPANKGEPILFNAHNNEIAPISRFSKAPWTLCSDLARADDARKLFKGQDGL